jgi:hypothetical protein
MPDAQPLRLWLTSRSAYESGFFCPRSRQLEYHSGPLGYGVVKKAESMPLATGDSIHKAIAPGLRWAMNNPTDLNPIVDITREACADAKAAYHKKIDARGLANLVSGDESLETIVTEQELLIDALPWCFYLEAFDDLLANYSIVSVEAPEELVLDCTCGLGDKIGTFLDHHHRQCDGIGLMGRLDFILRSHATGELAYNELKTAGQISRGWEEQWADKVQFVIGVSGAERRLEEPITAHAVYGLVKGSRRHRFYKPGEGGSGPIIQDTVLVYPYCREGNPPMQEEDWQVEYEQTDELTGKTTRLGKKYQKKLLTENRDAIAAAEENGMPLGEYWCRIAPPAVRKKHITHIGPLRISPIMKGKLLRQVVAVERDWQRRAWAIYEAFDTADGQWADPHFQATLDEHAPCSWECKKFTSRHACQFHRMCFEEAGWDEPLEGGYYIPRRPHHAAECQQAEDRGLLLPEEGIEEDEPE